MNTINYLLKTGAKVVIGTHIGRPNGKYDASLSTRIIADYLEKRVRGDVFFSEDCIGDVAKSIIRKADYGDIVVLENLRFHKEEEACDMTFASHLAEGMNIFVNDAFSCSHRAHASIFGVPLFIRPVAGLSFANEIHNLNRILYNNDSNSIAFIGGSKVSTKIDVLKNMVKGVGTLVVGGGMANTFLFARGFNVGSSLCEINCVDIVNEIYENAKESGCKIVIPEDVVVADSISNDSKFRSINILEIKEGDIIVDIGDKFLNQIKLELKSSKIILWNGPFGIFEIDNFANTLKLANIIADVTVKNSAISIAGGGDSVAVIKVEGIMIFLLFPMQVVHS
jgi:phosphoglycerate kinase